MDLEGQNDINAINNLFGASDYLGEETITDDSSNNLYTNLYNFIQQYIWNSDFLNTTNITIFNVTMTLGAYLTHLTVIILMTLIILLMVLLIRFIFKYVGGMFIKI